MPDDIFYVPALDIPPVTWATAPDEYWWLDLGPFKDRWLMDYAAVAASSHDVCKAVVALIEGRKYINLRDPRFHALFDALIANSQPAANPLIPGSSPMTVEKKAAVLTTPTTDYERHIKGLPQPV